MPAPLKASNERVRALMVEWRGNVQAVADALGMSTNALRARFRGLGLEPDSFRDHHEHAKSPGKLPTTDTLQGTESILATDNLPAIVQSGGTGPLPGGWGVSGIAGAFPRPGHTGQPSAADNFQSTGERSTLSSMSTAAAAADLNTSPTSPIKASASRHNQTLRIRPELRERIRQARLDLTAAFRDDYDDSAILERLIEDCIGPWLRHLLEGKPAPKAPRTKTRSRKTEK